MKIRNIINTIIASAAVLAVTSCGSTGRLASEQEFTKKLPVGAQLYSVRTDLEKDFYGTLKAVKEMGYAGVEFFGEYYGYSPLQVKKWCVELGLIPFSNHVPYQEMIDDIDKVIADNTVLGVQYIVFPYMPTHPARNIESFKKTVVGIGKCGAKVSEAGFQLLYHNHDFEFVKMEDGSLAYDYIFSTVGRELLQNEPDVCWIDYAGQSPVAYLEKYAGNIPVVHLKDYKREGQLSSDPYALIGVASDNSKKNDSGKFEFRPLGEGQVDIKAAIQAAIDGGAQWLCVEQDEPRQGDTRMDGLRRSAEYLRALGLM